MKRIIAIVLILSSLFLMCITAYAEDGTETAPDIIVQNDVGNKFSNTLIIAAISSSIKHKSHLRTHHIVNAGDGLTSNSVILLEQIRTIDKKRIISYIGHIDPKHIAAIEFALAISLGFISPDDKSITVCLCDDCITKFAN